MYSKTYTMAMAEKEIEAIIASKDNRVAYLISDRRIISSTVSPWKWRTYTGDDPHTNHWHLSVNDKHHDNLNPWRLSMALREHKYLALDDYSMAELHAGDDDAKFAGYRMVSRLQELLNYQGDNLTVDGNYGDKTVSAVKRECGGDGKTVGLKQWAVLAGLSTRAGV
jgi:hypothetical protein